MGAFFMQKTLDFAKQMQYYKYMLQRGCVYNTTRLI